MFTFDLLTPWIAFVATLIPLLLVQRWIHRHLFGVGYLVSREKWTATLLYYLILLPGVILHEISHYLVAGMFGIPSEGFRFWPHTQEDGWLEMGFVELEYIKNPVFAALVGIAPLVTGILTVVLISNSMLDLPTFFRHIGTGDINQIAAAFQTLFNKPDFFFWAYILFAVANAMMPNREDRVGWWVAGGAFLVFLVFMTVIGMGVIVANWLAGPVAQALASLSAVFGTVLAVDLGFAVLIWTIEAILGRVTGHRVEYSPHSLSTAVAGAPGKTFRSVYELALPIPPLPGKVPLPAAPRLQTEQRPALGAPSRPALSTGTSSEARSEEKPRAPAVPSRPAAQSASALSGLGSRPSPLNQPSQPARTFGTPAQDDEEEAAPGSTPAKPAAPSSPFGKPATTGGQPSRTFGTPAVPSRPAASKPSQDDEDEAAPGSTPAKPATPSSPFGKPATAFGQSGQAPRPGGAFGGPVKPPVSGPPALARPNVPVPGRPTLPVPADRPATPAPKTPFGAAPRPMDKPKDDDYIDAEYVDDDEEASFLNDVGKPSGGSAKPGNPFGAPPKKSGDEADDGDDEPKYIPLDEA